MVHVIAEVDLLVVYDKLSESCNPGDRNWLFHLLDARKDRDNERIVICFSRNQVSSLPSNTGVEDLGVEGGGKGIRGRVHPRASTRDPVRMIAAGLPAVGSSVRHLG